MEDPYDVKKPNRNWNRHKKEITHFNLFIYTVDYFSVTNSRGGVSQWYREKLDEKNVSNNLRNLRLKYVYKLRRRLFTESFENRHVVFCVDFKAWYVFYHVKKLLGLIFRLMSFEFLSFSSSHHVVILFLLILDEKVSIVPYLQPSYPNLTFSNRTYLVHEYLSVPIQNEELKQEEGHTPEI